MRACRLSLAAALAFLCTGPQQTASAYCVNIPSGQSKPVAWKTIPVTYRVSSNLKDAKILAAIDKAFATWGSVKCSKLKFKKGAQFKPCFAKNKASCPKGTVHHDHGESYIYVFWYTSGTGFPTDKKYASYMFLWFGMVQNIDGATIAVNAFNYKWNTTGGDKTKAILDVENEMVPLIGAVIGLNDSNTKGASMYPGMSFGDTSKRTLHADDKNGLVYLYKDTGCANPPPPDKSCGGTVPPQDGGGTQADGGGTQADGGGTQADGGVTYDWGSAGGDGQGGKKCSGPQDCADDEICDYSGTCVKKGGDGDDGCSCAVGAVPRAPSSAWLLLAVVVGAVLVRRRRR